MRQTFSAGGVVVNQKGEVLVVSQHGRTWSLPKGHIDAGETAQEAAVREIEEESGVTDLKFIKELGSYKRHLLGKDPKFDDKSELKSMTFFLYTTKQTELKPIDPENPEARWVESKEVSNLLTHPKDKQFFESIRPHLKEVIA